MKQFKLTRKFNDDRITIDKLNFETFQDALNKAGKWMKSDNELESVVIENGEFVATYERAND